MTENIISDGLELMLFGMGTVVVFLTLLVIVTSTMSALVTRYAPAAEVGGTDSTAAPASATADATLLAVISAAIHKHRSRR
jgi:oxaloacetate decarboxylase gamma subunit